MKPRILFTSCPTFERWDWRNPDVQGIGGSETSLIEMARRLASRGYDVTAYVPLPPDCPDREHGGVHWRDLSEVDYTQAGLWILYRCPEVADKLNSADQKLWVVCQDEDYPRAWWTSYNGGNSDLVLARQAKLHRVLALCDAQANHYRAKYPRLHDKVCTSSNGLRRELVESVLAEPPVERNPRRIMYASSPDRALVPLLVLFERIRERVPDAELWVCYGFDNIDKMIAHHEAKPVEERSVQDVAHARGIAWLKERLKKPGIRHFGRMPQRELYRLWRQCGLWIYCNRFRETSAITSMEAQALGAVPIVCPVWAIAENVRYGVEIREHEPTDDRDGIRTAQPLGGSIDDPLTLARFVDEAVRLMREPAKQEAIRPAMMAWASEWFSYENIVDQWVSWIEG